jgi:hypothetical protein
MSSRITVIFLLNKLCSPASHPPLLLINIYAVKMRRRGRKATDLIRKREEKRF